MLLQFRRENIKRADFNILPYTPHGVYFDFAMATLLVPVLFHAEMAITGFDPFQTSSTI